MANEMPFEQPLAELRSKIEELRKFGLDKGIDFSEEIKRLEDRYRQLEAELYQGMSTSEQMQLARHPQRPTTLDLIPHIFLQILWSCTGTVSMETTKRL